MSPSRRGSAGAPRGSWAGNDSTLVAASLERQSRLSSRIAASSVSTTASSPPVAGTIAAASVIARRNSVFTLRCSFQSGDCVTISIVGAALRGAGVARARLLRIAKVIARLRSRGKRSKQGNSFLGLSLALCLECRLVIGVDDASHELVTDNVLGAVDDVTDPLDIPQKPSRFRKAGRLSGRQVPVARIAGDDHPPILPEPRQEHLHLHRGRILSLVQDDDRIRERASPHEGERRDLDLAGLQCTFDDACVHEVLECVVDRSQIWIDLLTHVAGKKSKPLARLDRRTGENDAVDLLALKQLHRLSDREPGLAGARGSGAEHQGMAAQRADIGVLRGRARANRPLAQIDLLECRSRSRGVIIEQGALRDGQADGAFDVAGYEFIATLELLVQSLEHAPRPLDAVT